MLGMTRNNNSTKPVTMISQKVSFLNLKQNFNQNESEYKQLKMKEWDYLRALTTGVGVGTCIDVVYVSAFWGAFSHILVYWWVGFYQRPKLPILKSGCILVPNLQSWVYFEKKLA